MPSKPMSAMSRQVMPVTRHWKLGSASQSLYFLVALCPPSEETILPSKPMSPLIPNKVAHQAWQSQPPREGKCPDNLCQSNIRWHVRHGKANHQERANVQTISSRVTAQHQGKVVTHYQHQATLMPGKQCQHCSPTKTISNAVIKNRAALHRSQLSGAELKASLQYK